MSARTIIVFDVAAFRLGFPAFSNDTTFPDEMLQMYWDRATCYISDVGNYGWLQGDCRALALNLMTAHLLLISLLVAAGKTSGLVQNAAIDKINVGLTPPPLPSQWQWWLNSTEYGKELLALLQARSAGGDYIGGYPERAAFHDGNGRCY